MRRRKRANGARSVPIPAGPIVLSLSETKPHNCTQYIPDSIACRLYLLTILVETAIDLAIEGDIILRFHESASSTSQDMATRRMLVYLSISTFAQ